MNQYTQRSLWLVGLAIIIAHTLILLIGGVAMLQVGESDFFPWQRLEPLTAVAYRIHFAGPEQLIIGVALNLLLMWAYFRAPVGRPYRALFLAALIPRIALAMLGVLATAYLIIASPVSVRTSPVTGVWLIFGLGSIWGMLASQVLLGLPLIIFALRWAPRVWPPHRRRLRRVRQGLCVYCGYDLRSCRGLRCPECGIERTSGLPLNA